MPASVLPRRRLAGAIGRAGALTQSVAGGSVAVLCGYLGLLSVLGATRRPRSTGAAPSGWRFAVLVPAHDEEAVIADAVASLHAQRYPAELVRVHVVADNCTDRTAEIAEAGGAEAHRRAAPDDPGKGAALNWLLGRLVQRGDEFDAVVVVDADTVVDPGFLAAAAHALEAGAEAVQGFYAVREEHASTAAGIRAAALACRHHLRPSGRMAIGGSCGLFGNGMVFRAELARRRPWSGHLTEDMEFQLDLLLDGHRVVYVPGARVEAEMPATLAGSTTQNQRWELGRIQLARTYLPRLARVVRRGGPCPRPVAVDAMADLLVPPLSVLVAANGATLASAAVLRLVRGRRLDRVNLALAVGSSVVVVGHVVAGLVSVGAPRSTYRALLGAPAAVLWKVRLWAGVLARPDDVTWRRTGRNADTVTATHGQGG